jgi:hypothetical protein
MKCGKPLALGQAFCKDCLEDMSHYPVSPTTPVQIPPQPTVSTSKRNTKTKKARKPEEQILRLRKIVRIQTHTILLLLLLLIGLGIYSYSKLYPSIQPLRPGENYLTTEVVTQPVITAPQ